MDKVLTERGSRGGDWARTPKKPRDLEDAPAQEPVSRGHRKQKMTQVNLGPFENFLLSRVGKKWDDVYSEICANPKMREVFEVHISSTSKRFVFVELSPLQKDGKLYGRNRWQGEMRELFHGALYVCPETKILKKYKLATLNRKGLPVEEKRFHRYTDTFAVRKIDDVWYELKLAPLPDKPNADGTYPTLQDAALGTIQPMKATWGFNSHMFCVQTSTAYGDGKVYAVSKRQLGSKKIRQLKLT
jgi:hypothetical protein